MKNVFHYVVGNYKFSIATDQPLTVEDKFSKFVWNGNEFLMERTFNFKMVKSLPDVKKIKGFSEKDLPFAEYEVDGKLVRCFFTDYTEELYGILYPVSDRVWDVYYLEQWKHLFNSMDKLFFHLAFERQMVESDAIILHSSLIDINGVGVLFSGPSGIGKSTQADLWCQFEGAKIINGDKVILRKEDGVWFGYGSPFAGSSKIYCDVKVPICAVAFLNRAVDVCSCRRLDLLEAFKKMYSQTTLNSWNESFSVKSSEMIGDFCMDVFAFELRNRKDYSSVKCLKETLIKEGIYGSR